MADKRIDSLYIATPGVKSTWNNYTLPVPSGVYVYDDVEKIIKIGNGTNTFSELPVWLNVAEINEGVIIDLSRLGVITEADIDKIMVVNSLGKYVVGSITISYLIDSLTRINNKDLSQNTALDIIKLKSDSIELINGAPTGSIVAVNSNNKMAPLSTTLSGNKTNIVNAVKYAYGLKIIDFKFYIDSECTIEVVNFSENLTYYAKITATDSNSLNIEYSLACEGNTGVIITKQGTNVFSISIPLIEDSQVLTLTASVNNGYGTKTIIKTPSVFGYSLKFNRNTGNDAIIYNKIKMDRYGNFIAVGSISVGGVGLQKAIVSKFSGDMIVIAEKVYAGDNVSEFVDVIVNSLDQYIVVGFSKSENQNAYSDGIIMTFTKTLDIITKKRYTHTQNIYFRSLIVDIDNNYVVVGESYTTLNVFTVVVVKFNKDLNIISKRAYDASKQVKGVSIKLDNTNKYIVAGDMAGIVNRAGFIMKLDSSLNILSQKVFESTVNFYLKSLAIDKNNNYIVVGYGETTEKNAFIIKFNNILNILDTQRLSGTYDEVFNDICIDKNNYYALVGSTNTETDEIKTEAMIFKLQDTLSPLKKKKLTIPNSISLNGITVDSINNFIVCGSFETRGFVAKINSVMSLGTSSNLLSQLEYKDCGLSFAGTAFTAVPGSFVANIPTFSLFSSLLAESSYFDTRIIGTI